jgi:hypothetical protein
MGNKRRYSRDELEALHDQYEKPSGFEKYSASFSGQTGEAQTDVYFGDKGEKGGHIAVNANGDTEHVRDSDGEVLYEKLDPDNPYS